MGRGSFPIIPPREKNGEVLEPLLDSFANAAPCTRMDLPFFRRKVPCLAADPVATTHATAHHHLVPCPQEPPAYVYPGK